MTDTGKEKSGSKGEIVVDPTPAKLSVDAPNPAKVSVDTPTPAKLSVDTPTPAKLSVDTPTAAQSPVVSPTPAKPPVASPAPAKLSVVTPTPAKPPVVSPTPGKLSVVTPAKPPMVTPTPAKRSMDTQTPAKRSMDTPTPYIPPNAPAPYPTTFYARAQQYGGQIFNFNQQPKTDSLFGKIVLIAELVILFISLVAWLIWLGYYIAGSVEYYKDDEESDPYSYSKRNQRDRYNKYGNKYGGNGYSQNKYNGYRGDDDRYGYGGSSYYRAAHDYRDSYSLTKGRLTWMLVVGLTIGFAIELGLFIELGVGVFRKSFELCIGWLSARIAIFLFEFIGFVYLCADRYEWWAILLAVVYLLYRIVTIIGILAFGNNIYRSSKKVNPAQTETV